MSTAPSPPARVFPTLDDACLALAAETAELVRSRAAEGRPAVLGLPTGSTPLPFYRELVRLHRAADLSFRNVVTFNLDEYLGLGRRHPQSYRHYMHENLFDHVDLPPGQVHLPRGETPDADLPAHCQEYESAIRQCGGIDLMILGIGRNGHIGFNEPGSPRASRTRVVQLGETTRHDAAESFGGLEQVPYRAVSMGVASILDCRRIVLLAGGEAKAGIVQAALRGPVTPELPASFLQEHPDTRFYLDAGAATELE
ncbi:MAG: glucosamine-6-phosphate deaminase [Akkermansiaceae bacterium]|nr:glucosamine-6-phosphate deaminase [Akkermansiaceae bacterium]NNM31362.1 glucosamine-6-phosphate deaminase [Akkermansiaceae bacterium]